MVWYYVSIKSGDVTRERSLYAGGTGLSGYLRSVRDCSDFKHVRR